MIYKIFRTPEWEQLQRDGQTPGAPIDVQDGFVHFSTAGQMRDTAVLHFAGVEGLVLLAVDDARLGDDLKWEPSRGGALFPHLFRHLKMDDVETVHELPLVNGVHAFPEGLA